MNKVQIENLVVSELNEMLETVSDADIEIVINKIKAARNIVTIGAGRMGYSIKSFTMRLTHFGFNAFHLGDTNVQRITSDDLVIFASSSGETPSNVILAQIARASGAQIICVTCNQDSTIARLADYSVILKNIKSQQLMKTAPEHATYMLYDMISCKIAESSDIKFVEHNHSILE